jgi:hypothetical protein
MTVQGSESLNLFTSVMDTEVTFVKGVLVLWRRTHPGPFSATKYNNTLFTTCTDMLPSELPRVPVESDPVCNVSVVTATSCSYLILSRIWESFSFVLVDFSEPGKAVLVGGRNISRTVGYLMTPRCHQSQR